MNFEEIYANNVDAIKEIWLAYQLAEKYKDSQQYIYYEGEWRPIAS